jgi:hypothetical protein
MMAGRTAGRPDGRTDGQTATGSIRNDVSSAALAALFMSGIVRIIQFESSMSVARTGSRMYSLLVSPNRACIFHTGTLS